MSAWSCIDVIVADGLIGYVNRVRDIDADNAHVAADFSRSVNFASIAWARCVRLLPSV